MLVDRRRYKRYRTRKDTFVGFKSGALQLGRMINIGQDGFTFYYVDTENPIVSSSKIDIFLANELFRLTDISFEIVSDFFLNGNISNNTIKLRQCCVEFDKLTHFQSSSLDYFLENYTTGEF